MMNSGETIEISRFCCETPEARLTGAGSTALGQWPIVSMSDSQARDTVTGRLLHQHGDYCEALFEQLAAEAPGELLALVRFGGLRPGKLTFALEALGATGLPEGMATLIENMRHRSALVREGAILGALRSPLAAALRPTLERLAHLDPSPAVRERAESAIDYL